MITNVDKDLQVKAFDEICDCIFNDDKAVETHLSNMKHIYESLFNTKESNIDLMKAMNAFKIAFEKNPNETIKSILENTIFVKSFGEVFTPEYLINDMTKKLPKFVWKNPNLKWLDNSCGTGNFLVFIKDKLMRTLADVIPDKTQREKHILENMIYGVDIQAKNCLIAKLRLGKDKNFELNIEQHDSLSFGYWDKKFDIIVGNPPYNDSSRSKIGGKSLWDKFVVKSMEILNDNGFLVYVHPPKWRNPSDKLYSIFSENNLIYLNINSYQQGAKTFGGRGTNFDWYVLQKAKYSGKTTINDIDDCVVTINLSNWSWIPNGKFDIFTKIIAEPTEDSMNIEHSWTAYESRKKHMSSTKTPTNIHPCIYYIDVTSGTSLYWSSDNSLGHFGIPKIIYASGAGSLEGKFIFDKDGNYGMTQFSFGIVDTVENLQNMQSVLSSDKFLNLIPYMVISKNELNLKTLKTFKKDFWKEIV